MPKGIRNVVEKTEDSPVVLRVTMQDADYRALAALAADQYRTAELQAGWLLAKVLRDAGLAAAGRPEVAAHRERILARAAENGSNGS